MPQEYKTPGVYIQELASIPSSVVPVETAIPAFIGYTEHTVEDPKKITSFPEFQETFGGPPVDILVELEGTWPNLDLADPDAPLTLVDPKFFLFYSVQLYFANGGGPCYVVSAGLSDGLEPEEAELKAALDRLRLEDEPTLIVIPDAIGLPDRFQFSRIMVAALEQCGELQDRFTIMDLFEDGDVVQDVSDFRSDIGTRNLKYGAAYYPRLKTSFQYPDTAIMFSQPEGTGQTVTAQGADPNLDGFTLAEALEESSQEPEENSTETPYSDILNRILPSIRKAASTFSIYLPSSPAIAGVYAATDRSRGVWTAPANVSLSAVIEPTVKLTSEEQSNMNEDAATGKSVNAIRMFTGRGTVVWGARTLAGNDNEWRYIPVRRLFIMAEESIRKATEFVVFEPNDANTWLRVQTMIENFLTGLWQDGALLGAKADDAFFVNVGLGSTMTQQDILEGKLIIDIGMAAVRPTEFIVLKISHSVQAS